MDEVTRSSLNRILSTQTHSRDVCTDGYCGPEASGFCSIKATNESADLRKIIIYLKPSKETKERAVGSEIDMAMLHFQNVQSFILASDEISSTDLKHVSFAQGGSQCF